MMKYTSCFAANCDITASDNINGMGLPHLLVGLSITADNRLMIFLNITNSYKLVSMTAVSPQASRRTVDNVVQHTNTSAVI